MFNAVFIWAGQYIMGETAGPGYFIVQLEGPEFATEAEQSIYDLLMSYGDYSDVDIMFCSWLQPDVSYSDFETLESLRKCFEEQEAKNLLEEQNDDEAEELD